MIPVGNKVLIQPDTPEKKTEAGLIIPSKQKPSTGVVLALSEDYEFAVAVGDRVQYNNRKVEELEDGKVLVPEDFIEFKFN
jgi:co-chaperonin GroES (HSP10)